MEQMLEVIKLAQGGQWIALIAFVAGLIVRLLKSDTVLPFAIPPRYRAFAAFCISELLAIAHMRMAGATWQSALVEGGLAALISILGHDIVIEWLRGGKELGLGPISKSGSAVLLFFTLQPMTTGCQFSLEEARGPSALMSASPELSKECQHIDDQIRRRTAAMYAMTGLAGVSVVPSFIVDTPEGIIVASSVASGAAVGGFVTLILKNTKEKEWASKCAGGMKVERISLEQLESRLNS